MAYLRRREDYSDLSEPQDFMTCLDDNKTKSLTSDNKHAGNAGPWFLALRSQPMFGSQTTAFKLQAQAKKVHISTPSIADVAPVFHQVPPGAC